MVFRDLEVFDVLPRFGDVQEGSLDDFAFDSRGYGVATPWKTSTRIRRTAKFPFVLSGRNAIGEFRRFFQRHEMRLRPFWLPAYTSDFPLVADAEAGAPEILCAGHQFSTRYTAGTQHGFIAFITSDEQPQCYGVVSVVPSGSNDLLTLSRALDSDLVAEETICCPLLLVRAAEDALSLEYCSGHVAMADVGFVEVPAEYPDPAEDSSGMETVHKGSHPVFLYRVNTGTDALHYADFGCDLSAAGLTWRAADIQHGPMQSATDLLGDGVEVTIRTDDPDHPLRKALSESNLACLTLDLYDTDLTSLEELDLEAPAHTGRVVSVEFEKEGEIRLRVSSLFRLGEREIPTLRIQRTCNWRTYDGIGCHANAADFTTSGVVSGLSGDPAPYVEAAEFGLKALGDPNWFALGKVTIGDEQRTCTGQAGNRLYLNLGFLRAQIGDSVSALAGDDKRVTTCQNKFGQLINHSGIPYLPNSNPQLDAMEQPAATGGKKG